jgi:mannose-1-phosphate guanylyltransferase
MAVLPQPHDPMDFSHQATARRDVWAIVLAGGQGHRLAGLTAHIHGKARPKQYAELVAGRSMLALTLDRVARLVPPGRTLIASLRDQAPYLTADVRPDVPPHVMLQPDNRGTAAAVLLAVRWIVARDPDATVAVFPSDHFIREDDVLMFQVAAATSLVWLHPERIILLGAEPSEIETEYGWIEPGDVLYRTLLGPICSVRRFVEKPSVEEARACLARGALWNTFLFVACGRVLLDIGRRVVPGLFRTFDRMLPADVLAGRSGALAQSGALEAAYRRMPCADFSTAVLQRTAPDLAVSRLAGVTWCDWGSSDRVVRTLRRLAITPPWLASFGPASGDPVRERG